MSTIRAFLAVSALLSTAAVPALAGVTINAPSNNSQVSSPFNLSAAAVTCASHNVSAMGYSFDSSSDTTIVNAQSIDASISSASGNHILHVKAWGGGGSSCVTDVAINVSSGSSIVPWNATTVSNIEAMSGWQAEHDNGGPGWSSGAMAVVNSPSISGASRQFVTNYSNGGDERYSLNFSDDTQAENFFYDAWIYVTDSAGSIGNLEMDTNQTIPNGQTVMIGVQCDGYSESWTYTVNEGSSANPQPRWVSAPGTHCNVRSWSQWTWHHVQAYYSRSSSGWINYHSVWLDGAESPMNVWVFGAFDLGWGPNINTQFQIDGLGSSGQSTVYVANLKVSRW